MLLILSNLLTALLILIALFYFYIRVFFEREGVGWVESSELVCQATKTVRIIYILYDLTHELTITRAALMRESSASPVRGPCSQQSVGFRSPPRLLRFGCSYSADIVCGPSTTTLAEKRAIDGSV